jgi:general stress protein 26
VQNPVKIGAWLVLSFYAPGVLAAEGLDTDDLFRESAPIELITAALSIIAKDPFPALISIDAQGIPRVRTVELRPLEDDLEFWLATKPNTRKVTQIRRNPEVSLYFSVDAEGSYVSVMGTAVLHEDDATKAAMSWRAEAARSALWPDFPDDYLLIEIKPAWIEVIGAGVAAHIADWRPQAIVIDK